MNIDTFLHRENLHKATILKRIFALFIDTFIILVLISIINSNLFTNLPPNISLEALVTLETEILKFYFPLTFIYQLLFVTLYGATAGKMIMKIRIIDLRTGDIPTVWVALNRSTVRIISELVWSLGFIWAIFEPNRQAWHDKSAKTLVIDA